MLPPPIEAPPFEALLLTNKLILKNNLMKAQSWWSSSRRRRIVVRGVKEESQRFEVDPEKATEALKNLDQQFQSRSQKQVRSRPNKQPAAPSLNFTRNKTKEAAEEFSGSFFTYTAAALIAFSIFYNVLFYTVIKPSIDGFSENAPTASVDTPK